MQALVASGEFNVAQKLWHDYTGWSPNLVTDLYGPGDTLFRQRKHLQAFAAYNQTFFDSPATSFHIYLNPQSYDSGARNRLQKALAFASEGSYTAAEKQLIIAATEDPYFAEGQYLMGNMRWATCNKAQAIAAWKSAVANTGYAQPPSGWYSPTASVAALDMIFLHGKDSH